MPQYSLLNLFATFLISSCFCNSLMQAQNLTTSQHLTSDMVNLNLCDDDNDGHLTFIVEELIEQIIQVTGIENDYFTEQIVISSSAGIFAINNPSTLPSLISICEEYSAYDVAVDSQQNIYLTGLVRIEDDCSNYNYGVTSWQVNSLSFDDLDQVYSGFGDASYVIRRQGATTGTISSSEIWHDFGSGTSGGDFVLFNEKIYVAWKTSGYYRLYEVTVNANRDYVSHIDLGQLPNKTYGLAKEYDKLYGVTPTKLYEIHLENFSFTDVFVNPNPEIEWYGAAGLHEAVTFNITLHDNENDAQNGDNAFGNEWTNTLPYAQTIYLRIENVLTQEVDIINVNLAIYDLPVVNTPQNLEECYVDTYNSFDLNVVTAQMQINNDQNLRYTYYSSNPETDELAEPASLNFQPFLAEQYMFVKVENLDGGCTLYYQFMLINNLVTEIEPLSDSNEPYILNNCYLDSNSDGYFDLSEIEPVIVQENEEFDFSYFLSYEDAENDIYEIPSIYYLEESRQAIFIKVTDENGCYSISNFFIDYDCIRNNTMTDFVVFPKFITPNNDGRNDFWNVKGVSKLVMEESKVTIFDRYGRVLASFIPSSTLGWDGKADGVLMPANDYWVLFETNFGFSKTGHFTLKR